MKRNILLAAGAACAIAAAAQVMAAGPTIKPGLYETNTRLTKANMPGMPASAMKAMMAKAETKRECVTAEQVSRDPFSKTSDGCKPTKASIAGGKINMTAQCKGGRTSKITGTYTPTTYNIVVESGSAGGSMTFNKTGRRVGDCTGDEE